MSPTTKYASLTPDVLSTNKFKRGKYRYLSPDSSGKQMYNSFRKFNPGQYAENSPEWQVAMLQYLLDMKNHGHKVQEVSVDKVITITTYDLFLTLLYFLLQKAILYSHRISNFSHSKHYTASLRPLDIVQDLTTTCYTTRSLINMLVLKPMLHFPQLAWEGILSFAVWSCLTFVTVSISMERCIQ